MQDEADYYRSVLDNLGGGFLGVDLSGRVAYGNPTAGRILHIPIQVILGKPYRQALEPYPALCDVIGEALDSEKVVRRAEVSIRHGDAQMVIGYSTMQVRGRRGENMGVEIIFQDLTLVLPKKVA